MVTVTGTLDSCVTWYSALGFIYCARRKKNNKKINDGKPAPRPPGGHVGNLPLFTSHRKRRCITYILLPRIAPSRAKVRPRCCTFSSRSESGGRGVEGVRGEQQRGERRCLVAAADVLTPLHSQLTNVNNGVNM